MSEPRTPREYLKILVDDIVATGGLKGRTPEQAIRDAHEARQAFLLELTEGQTDRAKAAREIIQETVYHKLRGEE